MTLLNRITSCQLLHEGAHVNIYKVKISCDKFTFEFF